jgi:hypothetical protein
MDYEYKLTRSINWEIPFYCYSSRVVLGLDHFFQFLSSGGCGGDDGSSSSSTSSGSSSSSNGSSKTVQGLTQLLVEWVPRDFSTGVKRLGPEADHLPPTIAEVKKTWICSSIRPYVFMSRQS